MALVKLHWGSRVVCGPPLRARLSRALVAAGALALAASGAGAADLDSVSVSPSTVSGYSGASVTVTLDSNAGAGGCEVYLYVSRRYAVFDHAVRSITVPAGQAAETMPNAIVFGGVSQTGEEMVVASYGTRTRTATFTVQPGSPPPWPYTCENRVAVSPMGVANLRLTRIFMDHMQRIEWDGPETLVYQNTKYRIWRDGTWIADVDNQKWHESYCAWPSNTTHTYSVQTIRGDSFTALPSPPPPGTPPAQINTAFYIDGPPTPPDPNNLPPASGTAISYIPTRTPAVQNQAVDSRVDPRYSAATPVNFKFGSRTYRGGLFVGCVADADNSGVSRTLAKFHTYALAAGEYIWAGSVSMYLTRMRKTGSINVGAHYLEGDGISNDGHSNWTASSVDWSSTYGWLNPAAPLSLSYRPQTTATWDPTPVGSGTSPAGWYYWNVDPWIIRVFEQYRYVSFGFALANEPAISTSTGRPINPVEGWSYFAKSQTYTGSRSPYLLYAKGDTGRVFSIALEPPSVTGGNSLYIDVWLNGPAPTGGAIIWFASDDPFVCQPPAHAVIPAGGLRARFSVATSAVTSQKTVTLRAFWQSRECQTTLTVTP